MAWIIFDEGFSLHDDTISVMTKIFNSNIEFDLFIILLKPFIELVYYANVSI